MNDTKHQDANPDFTYSKDGFVGGGWNNKPNKLWSAPASRPLLQNLRVFFHCLFHLHRRGTIGLYAVCFDCMKMAKTKPKEKK